MMPLPFKSAAVSSAVSSSPADTRPAQKRPQARKSKYAEVKVSEQRDSMAPEGTYRVRIDDTEAGYNEGTGTESFKVSFTVIESGEDSVGRAGDSYVAIFLTSGKAGPSGVRRVKDFAVAGAGYAITLEELQSLPAPQRAAVAKGRAEAFDAWEAELGYPGAFIDALERTPNGVEHNLDGELVDLVVSRGRDRVDAEGRPIMGPDGKPDWYRDYRWFSLPEALRA